MGTAEDRVYMSDELIGRLDDSSDDVPANDTMPVLYLHVTVSERELVAPVVRWSEKAAQENGQRLAEVTFDAPFPVFSALHDVTARAEAELVCGGALLRTFRERVPFFWCEPNPAAFRVTLQFYT